VTQCVETNGHHEGRARAQCSRAVDDRSDGWSDQSVAGYIDASVLELGRRAPGKSTCSFPSWVINMFVLVYNLQPELVKSWNGPLKAAFRGLQG
jgi:hypothetical protein